MKKMKTPEQSRGRRTRLVVLVALAMAIVLATAGGLSAFAASAAYFYPIVGGEANVQDGQITRSLTDTIDFNADSVFRVTSSGINQVKAFRITSSDIRTNTALQLAIDTANDKRWTVTQTQARTEFLYKSDNAINYSNFNQLMSRITLKFRDDMGQTSGTGKVSIIAYSNKAATDSYRVRKATQVGTKEVEHSMFGYTWTTTEPVYEYTDTYTCQFLFYDYAKGDIDESSVDVDYKSSYAASYNSKYEDDVPDGQVNGVAVNPDNSGGGKVSFNMHITEGTYSLEPGENVPSYGYKAWVGYQYKKAGSNWDSRVSTNWVMDGGKNKDFLLYQWDPDTPIPVTITGLDQNTTYIIRGVIATDGKTDSPVYTKEITVRYDGPNISNFRIGSTSQVYKSGDPMDISTLITFVDSNAVGKTYTGIDGNTYTGPALRAALYFTNARTFTTQNDGNGNEVPGVDNSKWYILSNQVRTKQLNGDDAMTAEWLNFPMPSSLQDYTGNPADSAKIDSARCAFKLVVTDLYTGFTNVAYSDPFTIDSSAPHGTTITARDNKNNTLNLDLPAQGGTPVTVGGEGAHVNIYIGGADDGEGSGVREYSYSMFYLASGTGTTWDILNSMKSLTASDYGTAEYSPWASAQFVNDEWGNRTNMAQITVARGGYYRILARAVDNADRESETVEAYFFVDLTMPDTPQLRTARETDPNRKDSNGVAEAAFNINSPVFFPYNDSTYSTDKVWLFIGGENSGKTIDTIEFSTDGGLTWINALGTGNQTVNGKSVVVNQTQYVIYKPGNAGTVEVYDRNAKNEKLFNAPHVNFKYTVAVNMSGLGYNDYVSVIARVKDSLGNVSLTSEPSIIRTVGDTPTGTAEMSHDPIEVALAMGNINLDSNANPTKDVKNAAAHKINEKFYGTSGSTAGTLSGKIFTPSNPDTFNPHLYTANHNCTWDDETACIGSCNQSNCPYAIMEASGFAIYKAEDINVQGMSSGDAAVGMTWYRFDHNNTGANTTYNTTLRGLGQAEGKKTYYNSAYGLYIAADSWVQTSGYGGTAEAATASGAWSGTVLGRIYHMIPFGTATGYATMGSTMNLNALTKDDFAIKEIHSYGYTTNSLKDWMFLYVDNSAKKQIAFTINDANLHQHSNDGYGFFFNSTVRQKNDSAKTWVLSGYLFYIFNNRASGDSTAYSWAVCRVTELPLATLCSSTTNENLGYKMILNAAKTATAITSSTFEGDQKGNNSYIKTVWYTGTNAKSLYGKKSARHFRLVISGSSTRIYVWDQGNTNNNQTVTSLEEKFNADTNKGTTNGYTNFTSGFSAIDFGAALTTAYKTDSVYDLYTPRAKVDGEYIGHTGGALYSGGTSVTRSKVHTDTNCFGFGIIVGSNVEGHSCSSDTQVVFSNMIMKITNVRKLSEVVTEPSWGNGKAKFICNLSDDAVTDFSDPVLTSQIQWRLNNDGCRYIGWGKAENNADTQAFLLRMAGSEAKKEDTGIYVSTATNYTASQIPTIAEYITRQYYSAFGFDVSSGSKTIKQQVSDGVGANAKGKVYALEDVDNIDFSIKPETYKNSSANPDFPSGRWYMVHDTDGYRNAADQIELDPRSGNFSDALETNINYPGRYTYYFAPNQENLNRLDPDEAVFDFVVNQTPVAQFTAGFVSYNASNAVVSNHKDATVTYSKVVITDSAYDPDWPWPLRTKAAPTGTIKADDGTKSTGAITGIVKTEWRWELLIAVKDSDGNTTGLTKAVSVDWQDQAAMISSGKLVRQSDGSYAINLHDLLTYGGSSTYNSTADGYTKASQLDDTTVLTMYQRVTDVSTRKVVDEKDPVTTLPKSYVYKFAGNAVSAVAQANVSTNTTITNPPSATFSMSSPFMYDTATGKSITITRNSSHSQNEPFALSWRIGIGSPKSDQYIDLEQSGDNYVWKESSSKTWTVLKYVSGKTVTKNGLGNEASISPRLLANATATKGGTWEISYDFIKYALEKYKDSASQGLVLQITESAFGYSATSPNSKVLVSDTSARTIFYKTDTAAPSPQVVVTRTQTDGVSGYGAYEATGYLEVGGDDKYIVVSASGSTDAEGSVAGYGYYFYDVDAAGKETNYYKLTSNDGKGQLQQITSLSKSTIGILPYSKTGSSDLKFGKGAMTKKMSNGTTVTKSPTDSLNLAIFAFDTQTGRSTITGANQAQMTRIEDIKLSTSEPMPPAITASSSLGEVIAAIGNDAGYDTVRATQTDTQTSDSNFFSNNEDGTVTVAFTPRQDKFVTGANGTLVKGAGGSTYYEDIYGHADLTATADIKYSVKYKASANENWWGAAEYLAAGMDPMPTDKQVGNATRLEYKTDGVYEITAVVVNGSGTESQPRTISFTIDRTFPAAVSVKYTDQNGADYTNGSWARTLTIDVGGGGDLNADKYQYTMDGQTWVDLGPVGSTQTLLVPDTSRGIPANTYQSFRLRAVDKAGNYTYAAIMPLRVDNEPPQTVGPTLTVDSTSADIYDEYIVSVNYDASCGGVYSTQKGVTNTTDDLIYVAVGGSVRLEFHPEPGRELGSVIVREQGKEARTYNTSNLTLDSAKGVYYLDMVNVTADATVTVTFPTEGTTVISGAATQADAAMKALNQVTGLFLNSYGENVIGGGMETRSGDIEVISGAEGDSWLLTHDATNSLDYSVEFKSGVDTYGKVADGQTATVAITPGSFQRVEKVVYMVAGSEFGNPVTEFTVNDGVYTFTTIAITDNTQMLITMADIPAVRVTVKSSNASLGTVTLQSGNNIALRGSGVYSVAQGTTVTVVPNIVDNSYKPSAMRVTQSGVTTTMGVGAYTVGDTSTDDIEIVVDYDLNDAIEKKEVKVTQSGGGTVEPAGTVKDDGFLYVNVPKNPTSSRLFTFTPAAGYRLDSVQSYEYDHVGRNEELIYAYKNVVTTPIEAGSRIRTAAITSDSEELLVTFVPQTYTVTMDSYSFGTVNVYNADTNAPITIGPNGSLINEGTNLRIDLRANDECRLRSLTLVQDGASIEAGLVSSYTLYNLRADTQIKPKFERRTVSHTQTTHTIRAQADNINDASGAGMAAQPYQYAIVKGTVDNISTANANSWDWSDWTSNYTTSFSTIKQNNVYVGLEPNTAYTVYIRTRDAVGNESQPMGTTVYTMANAPAPISVTVADDAGDSVYKSVKVTIDTAGNAPDTEYLVWASTSSSSIGSPVADGWTTLTNGTYTAGKLTPSTRYFLRVQARNKSYNGSVVQPTELRERSTYAEILLGPAAPEANTLYVAEPESPASPIVLYWDTPPEDVKSVEIFRDGQFLAEVPRSTLTYSDKDSYKFFADSIVTYSYAYADDGGSGSTQDAITEEYYNAIKAGGSKKTAMDNAVAQSPTVFSETLTYPAYPKAITLANNVVASSTSEANSGTITVTMNRDMYTMGRFQTYSLVLKAFTAELGPEDANGDRPVVSATEVTNMDLWDPTYKYHDRGTTVQKPVTTTIATRRGVATAATATWEKLSNEYVYQILVQEVSSNGAGAGGEAVGTGVEGLLGKSYFVNAISFGYRYTNDVTGMLNTKTTQWSSVTNGSTLLANYIGSENVWATPLHSANDYIRFNRSPGVTLAADPYGKNSASMIHTDSTGAKYILIDQNTSTFSIDVLAWDPDSKKADVSNMYVRGYINSVPGNTVTPIDTIMAADQTAAAANPYTLVFSTSGLTTGVYNSITLEAYDGTTSAPSTQVIRLVVNRSTPSATVENGVKHPVEAGRTMTLDELIHVTSTITRNAEAASAVENQNSLAKTALLVMPELYQQKLGSSDYNTLVSQLVNSSGAKLNDAKALLGANTGSDYVQSNGRLTERGLRLAILNVQPPVTKYLMISAAQYAAIQAEDPSGYASYTLNEDPIYWMEFSKAIDLSASNGKYCDWLAWSDNTKTGVEILDKVTGVTKDDTRTMKLLTSFGANTASQSVDFILKNHPSAVLLSDKHFGWTTTHRQEYEYFATSGGIGANIHEVTIGEMVAMYADSYENLNEIETDPVTVDGTAIYPNTKDGSGNYIYRTLDVKAFRITGSDSDPVYQVYKLTDEHGMVDTTMLHGVVRVDLGVHEKFSKAGIVLMNKGDTPAQNTDPASYSGTYPVSYANNGAEVTESKDYTIGFENLQRGHTYYLWAFYILPDGTVEYDPQSVALTTNEQFSTVYYGFNQLSAFYREKDNPTTTEGSTQMMRIDVLGSGDAFGTLVITPEYYQADENGAPVLDARGEMIPLTGNALNAAKATASLVGAVTDSEGNTALRMVLTRKDASATTQYFNVRLRNTTAQQGHMIMRLKLSVEQNPDGGFAAVTKGCGVLDIAVQDDESPVTSYLLTIADTLNTNSKLKETRDSSGSLTGYSYEYDGLLLDYTLTEELLITYQRAGTGDLNNIVGAVYQDAAGTIPSNDFEVSDPTTTNLSASLQGARGTMRVYPVSNLSDAVHEAWLILSADNMDPADYVKIHLRQVVGQSTLEGRVYITPDRTPLDTERTGRATISLYDYAEITWSGDTMNLGAPVYRTQTDDNGFYEIHNIINGRQYQVVVEREGFATYSSAYHAKDNAVINLADNLSRTYEWDLCLYGGDVNDDGLINSDDLNILLTYYNQYADLAGANADVVSRCDFNLDGVVNALDRAYLVYNIGFNAETGYSYAPFTGTLVN